MRLGLGGWRDEKGETRRWTFGFLPQKGPFPHVTYNIIILSTLSSSNLFPFTRYRCNIIVLCNCPTYPCLNCTLTPSMYAGTEYFDWGRAAQNVRSFISPMQRPMGFLIPLNFVSDLISAKVIMKRVLRTVPLYSPNNINPIKKPPSVKEAQVSFSWAASDLEHFTSEDRSIAPVFWPRYEYFVSNTSHTLSPAFGPSFSVSTP